MLALLAAATIAASPAPTVRVVGETPILRRAMACGLWHSVPAAQIGRQPQAKRLGDLPPANWEIAVLRLDANGCQKPVVVSYGVQGDGRFAGSAGK